MANYTFLIKVLSLVVLILIVNSIKVSAQGDIQGKQLFDYHWKFNWGDEPKASINNFDDKNWRSPNLPHDWSIEGQISRYNPAQGNGGFLTTGIGWYRKPFSIPTAWKDKRISIYFEGIYMNSEVFINGKSLGKPPYGYSTFTYDLTPYLKPGKDNLIAVRVDNSKQKNSRWYTGSGIYRHVWLVVTNPIRVPSWSTAIVTPEISAAKAIVRVTTLVKNETSIAQNIVLKTYLTHKNSKRAGNGQVKVLLLANGEKEVTQNITVIKPLLREPETPYLYLVRTRVLNGSNTIVTFYGTVMKKAISLSANLNH